MGPQDWERLEAILAKLGDAGKAAYSTLLAEVVTRGWVGVICGLLLVAAGVTAVVIGRRGDEDGYMQEHHIILCLVGAVACLTGVTVAGVAISQLAAPTLTLLESL